MAKSSSFFGLRRGSTKSLTFQVYRGQQITKDRVTAVSNPQTTAQMEQRLKVPMVASARATLKSLINHSFEGVAYGEESLKEFSRSNLLSGALTVTSYVPKGAMDCGEANFVVSKGTLPVNTVADMDGTHVYLTSAADWEGGSVNRDDVSTPANITSEILADLKKSLLSENTDVDQITFLAAYEGSPYNWDSDNGVKTSHFHRWIVSRLVFDTERFSENAGWQYTIANTYTYTLTNGYFTVKFELNQKPYIGLASNANICMAAVISSKLDDNVWRRSSQRVTVISNNTITYNDVVSTYLKDTEIRSGKYLNSGGDGVNITGGELTAEESTDTGSDSGSDTPSGD